MPRPLETVYCDSTDDDVSPVYLPIDIGPDNFVPETIAWQLTIPATLLNDNQKIVFELLHSDAEQGPYASMDAAMTVTIAGAGGMGTPARTVIANLPSGTKQFLVVSAVCDDGADVSAGPSFQLNLLF